MHDQWDINEYWRLLSLGNQVPSLREDYHEQAKLYKKLEHKEDG